MSAPLYWLEKVGGERQSVAQGPLALDQHRVVLPHLGDCLSRILNILAIPRRYEFNPNLICECLLPPVQFANVRAVVCECFCQTLQIFSALTHLGQQRAGVESVQLLKVAEDII